MKRFLLALTLIVAVALVMAGCGNTSEFSMGMELNPDGKGGVITVQDPDAGDCVAAGSIILGENDTVYIEPALEGDVVIRIQMFPESEADIDDDPALLTEEFTDESKEIPLEIDVSGTEPIECGIAPGDYMVYATTVTGSGSGTINIHVGEQVDPWTQAATAEEAAKGAGLDSFEVPDGVQTSLGPVAPLSFGYQEGVAEADISAAAVEMRARKGLKASYEDVSFDENEYKYEWSRDIGGTIVKCFGNRDGEATKTVWSDDTYSYALLAYGAGGDDDYGLPAEDLDGLVEAIK